MTKKQASDKLCEIAVKLSLIDEVPLKLLDELSKVINALAK